jgi:translation initiation factor IF-3
MKQAQQFLSSKEQVRVVLILKGRQKAYPQKAVDFLNKVAEDFLNDFGNSANVASVSNLSLTYNPKG